MNLKGLQRILGRRLPQIDRWGRVKVYAWDNAPYFIRPTADTFIIFWDKPKRKNIHPYEYKEIPMADLEVVADRNKMRLRNKTKQYK